jgi:ABC-type polysaccharide/polyol phosphate export permease
MEQGTPFGFILSFINNAVMLLVFYLLFVDRFLAGIDQPIAYLILGIIQWNLYVNVSLAGFSCFIYRQKLVMGYSFHRELLVFARTAAVYAPYLIELTLVLLICQYLNIDLGWKTVWLPFFIVFQYAFCCSICFVFSIVGILHRNVIPFWNIMFRILSFATPIFYVPVKFKSDLGNLLFSANPFSNYMIWIRDIVGVNNFILPHPPLFTLVGTIIFLVVSIFLFQITKPNIGDVL